MPKARTATFLLSSGSPWSASCQDLRRSSDSRIRFGDRWSIQRRHHHHPCLLLLPLGLKHHGTHNAPGTYRNPNFDFFRLAETGSHEQETQQRLVGASQFSPRMEHLYTEGFPLIYVHQFFLGFTWFYISVLPLGRSTAVGPH